MAIWLNLFLNILKPVNYLLNDCEVQNNLLTGELKPRQKHFAVSVLNMLFKLTESKLKK